MSECYSGGAESKARDESRCAAPDLVRRLSAENCRFLGRENWGEIRKAIRRDFAQIGNKIMRKGVHVESSLQGGIFLKGKTLL